MDALTNPDRARTSHVLVVEDDPDHARFVSAALEGGTLRAIRLSFAPRLSRALEELRHRSFDAIVLDLNLPDSHDLDTFHQVSAVAPQVPIIVHSANDDEDMAATLLREGAEDYIVKGTPESALDMAIRHAIERHRHREALRTSESRYRSLVEGTVQGILIHIGGEIRFANQALAALVGFDAPDEMVGQQIWPYIVPEDRPIVAEYARQRTQGREAPTRYELRISRRDGSVLWVDCTVSVIPWDGEPMLMAALVDVTNRKQAEALLRASEERFRLLANNIKEAFLIIELPGGRTLYLSRVWEEIWGRPVEEAYTNPHLWLETIDPGDRPEVVANYQTLQRGEPVTSVFRVHRPDGSTCWVRARLFPVFNDRGEVYRLVGLIEDITNIRQTEDQLRQALKMEAIGQLAGGIAHDFNNLLVVMGGYADLIAEDLGPVHRSRKDLEEIRTAARSAASLTRQLLAFSRKQILQPQILDLNQVLHRVELLLRRLIGEDITLTMHLVTPLARVQADPGQVEQIIMNLAVNARDAMPHGGHLAIETANVELDEAYAAQHRGASAGPHVMIGVSDTGGGMDEATQQRVFEPFFTTKPAGRGTGLGLSTVYGIVKQSGGSIRVYSELGKGSTFKIYFPVATARVEEPTHVSGASRLITGFEIVLVVEDQAEVRHLIIETLHRHGYRVLEAASGDAIEIARDQPVDVLLTDVVLPGSSGREVAKQVVTVRPSARVIYMSGYTDDVIVQHGVLDPGLAFIQKPFTADALLIKIRDVLEATEPPLW